MHSTVWFHKRWTARWYHKMKTKTLTGLVMNKRIKSKQPMDKKKINKIINNKDLVISSNINLNTCHNHKSQHMNKKK